MANNCSFQVILYCRDAEQGIRVRDILNAEDHEFTVVRTWGEAEIVESVNDGERQIITIVGECPWTADYFWRPENTIYEAVIGKSKDDRGRMVVSIPYLCQLWGMEAHGWEEEWGMCLDGTYFCGPDGIVRYTDLWPETCLEHVEMDMADEGWVHDLRVVFDAGAFDGSSRREHVESLLLIAETLIGDDE